MPALKKRAPPPLHFVGEVVSALDALAIREHTDRTDVLNHAIAFYLASKGTHKAPKRVLGQMNGPAIPADFDTSYGPEIRAMFEDGE